EIYSLKVDCKVTSRFARSVITSRAVNRANVSREVFFDVELPKTAFITNFSMVIDGLTYVGVVKEKEVAKKQYQQAVSRGHTAGLVKASGRKMEKFTVSVNIAATKKVTFEMTYEELLKRSQGRYELLIRVKPKQLVQHFEINVDIYEPQGLHFLDAHGTFVTNDLTQLIKKTVTETKGHISFSPTVDQQRSCQLCQTSTIDGDFIINYDVNRDMPAGDIQISNGYFVHYFAPSNLKRVPKNVIFVIDQSTSMRGTRIRQTKEAMLAILNDIHSDDKFNIISFDSGVTKWKPSIIETTAVNMEAAKQYVKSLYARGWTNINDALLEAIGMLNEATEQHKITENSISLIILLSDGDPTEGETNRAKIQSNVKNGIGGRYPLYCLGFGYDLDYSFIEKLALENHGVARRIYEDSDSALQMQGFYDEVASPLLSQIEMKYPENSMDDLTQHFFQQYYNGSEIVVAGRVTGNELDAYNMEVTAKGAKGDIVLKNFGNAQDREKAFEELQYIFGEYTERLWAYLTIQQLLNKRVSGSPEEKANNTARALELSLKYNFVTPLTSMVVTKPEDKPDSTMLADKLTEESLEDRVSPGPGLASPGVEQGKTVTNQVKQTKALATAFFSALLKRLINRESLLVLVDGDPHFIIPVPKQNDTICFNIDERPGVIFNLVRDPLTGITVNGQTIGDKKVDPNKKLNTYFGKFGIVNEKLGLRLEVTTQIIEITSGKEKMAFTWSDTVSIKQRSFALQINKERNLVVMMGDSVQFVIVLHRVWKDHPFHQDYLGFYTIDSHRLSSKTHGLLGQFYHELSFEVGDIHQGTDPEKPEATMQIKGQELTVTRGWQRDYREDIKHGVQVPCWFVHHNGTGLIDGVHSDYIVSGIFKTK
ncbi:ITIH3 inhibitor, partial [Polyodon spathula]|nr:ITIH3 inhibitor [Polyodon spathula]